MTTRRILTATIDNVRYLQRYARDAEESSSATAAIKRLRAIESMYGDLWDAIDAGHEAHAYNLVDRLIEQRPRKESPTP